MSDVYEIVERALSLPSLASVCIGALGMWLSSRHWWRTNRPMLTARIATVAGGNEGIALNLVVENTGNRPAQDIKLFARQKAVLAALAEPSGAQIPGDAQSCFFKDKEIPVLANGKAVTNAFGHLGKNPGAWLSGAKIPLKIKYKDLHGKKYSAKMNLILADDNGFAQTSWAIPTSQAAKAG
ncbi:MULTISPECIES: hypothetical protein [Pseudomonas]|uniref:hypothetical protein n=2 Tax=Pseudomonas TaxID=286 RepID=UPI000499F904|nr:MULTISPECIES: hypothetical protein [unclassified Pseudomonas]AIB44637.1 hypothetical protein PD374_26930 [Pseudomonas sp. WCS374]NMY58618.1 hypothetical protein [Pseudomonas sp. WS 5354]